MISNLHQSLPACIFCAFGIRAFGYAGVEILLHYSGVETTDYIDSERVVAVFALCPFVVDEACRVGLAQPCRHGGVVSTVATLVAKAPKDNRRIVLVSLCHAHGTVEEGSVPVGSAAESTTQTVGLKVSLVHDIDAETVAKLIPAWHVGVMGSAHGIDIGALHKEDILKHALLGHYACRLRVVLVAVYSTHLHRIAVYQYLAVVDADVTEAHAHVGLLDDATSGVGKFKVERVEVGIFCRPLLWRLDIDGHAFELAITALREPLIHVGCLMAEVENVFYGCRLATNFLATVVGEDGSERASLAALFAIDGELEVDVEVVVSCLS